MAAATLVISNDVIVTVSVDEKSVELNKTRNLAKPTKAKRCVVSNVM